MVVLSPKVIIKAAEWKMSSSVLLKEKMINVLDFQDDEYLVLGCSKQEGDPMDLWIRKKKKKTQK